MNWKKILHFIFGHKEELTDTIEIEGGELLLYLCACGNKSWKKNYRLDYLAKNNDISGEALKAMREISPLLALLPDIEIINKHLAMKNKLRANGLPNPLLALELGLPSSWRDGDWTIPEPPMIETPKK